MSPSVGDIDGDGLLEVEFTAGDFTGPDDYEGGFLGYVIHADTPSGSPFDGLLATFDDSTPGQSPFLEFVGDVDADGRDDLAGFGLFLGLSAIHETLDPTTEGYLPWGQGAYACDINADGQSDLCRLGSAHFGPLDVPGQPDLRPCLSNPSADAIRLEALAAGWSESYVAASSAGAGRHVVYALDEDTASSAGTCTDMGARFWTVPRDSHPPSFATADFTGDGVTDLAITISGDPAGESGVYVFSDPAAGPAAEVDSRDAPIWLELPFPDALATLSRGDVDGDGQDDVILVNSGHVVIYRGPLASGDTAVEAADGVFHKDDLDRKTLHVSDVHDVDGDGQDDVLLSDPDDDLAGLNAGKIYVVWSGGIGSNRRDEALPEGLED
jgi:hypothetical protein